MKNGVKLTNTKIHRTIYDVAESIEEKMRRVTANKEPIDASAPLIYTEEKDGVMAGYDIRTDRFEVALEAQDKINAANAAKRDNAIQESNADDPNKELTPITE